MVCSIEPVTLLQRNALTCKFKQDWDKITDLEKLLYKLDAANTHIELDVDEGDHHYVDVEFECTCS